MYNLYVRWHRSRGPGSLLTTDSLSSYPTNATHVDSLPHCTGSIRRAFLKDGIRIQVRRLVLACRICANEEKLPPPSQITELIKQRWNQTPIIQVHLTRQREQCGLHSTVPTTLKMCPLSFVSCGQYSASRKGSPTHITASAYHSSLVRRPSALGLTSMSF